MEQNVEQVTKTTPDLAAEQVAHLKAIFPECVTEGRVDLDRLRATLGDLDALTGQDTYSFTWAGKQEAFRAIQTPSAASLAPVPEESVNWETTGHVFIEGENLEVLKLLYKSYFGKVKMIYIDPPYNTGNDFIYQDDYRQPLRAYLEKTGQVDVEGNVLRTNTGASGRYHSDWLNMMYPRLFLARQLLREDGVILVSIDDHEMHHLRLLMNEVFGSESFIGMFVWQSKKGGGSDKAGVVSDHEYVMCFGRKEALSRVVIEAEELDREDGKGLYRRGRELNKWGAGSRREDRPTMYFPISGPGGEEVFPIRNDGTEGRWRWGKERMLEIVDRGDVEFERRVDGTYVVYEKIRSTDPRYKPYRTWLTNVGTTADGSKTVKELFGGLKVYDFPKPVDLVKHLVSVGTEGNGDVVLDFFAGSCTVAEAVMQCNRGDEGERQFVCVQLAELTPRNSMARKAGYETVADIGKERIRRVIAQMQKEDEGKLDLHPDEDLGFKVFKLQPSTFHQWQAPTEDDVTDLADQLSFFDHGLVEGADPQHVIYEVLLKEGYSLNAQIDDLALAPAGNQVYRVTDEGGEPFFYVCLDEAIAPQTMDALHLERETAFVCLDTALDDSQKVNLAMQCQLKVI